jgi:DNA invertase Pin-like site-specific DNA recombinase
MSRSQRKNVRKLSQQMSPQIIRVALYARVSTLNNQDPEMQLRELREYAGRRGWQIADEYTDQGVSGCKESRPALNQLMSDACSRRFDAILVWKIDRFGRSLKRNSSVRPARMYPPGYYLACVSTR